MIVDVTYSVNGLIGPLTDAVEVSEAYTTRDVTVAIDLILAEASVALDRKLSIRHILLIRPHRS